MRRVGRLDVAGAAAVRRAVLKSVAEALASVISVSGGSRLHLRMKPLDRWSRSAG